MNQPARVHALARPTIRLRGSPRKLADIEARWLKMQEEYEAALAEA